MADQGKKLQTVGGTMQTYKQDSDINNLVYGRVQPQALPLEEAVLGAILIDKDGLPAVIEILKKESFYKDAHQEIYGVMLSLFEKQQPIDILTVHEVLKKEGKLDMIGGVNYLMDLSNKVASSANIEFHARIITQKFIQRELIRVSTLTIKDSFDDHKDVLELLDDAERGLYDITDQNLNTGYESVGSVAVKVQKEIDTMRAKGDDLTGVTTGFAELDKMTNGWQPSDLIIIAARPGMGKTAFTLSLAKNAAEHGHPVVIFSLEMANNQLVSRLISMDSEINSRTLRNGQLGEGEFRRLHDSVAKLSEVPIFVDDTPALNIFELRAKCRRLKQNHGIKMVVIDYLQLMSAAPSSGRGNREQEISSISRALKGMAKELNVPVIALSQLSRAVETRGGDKKPQLSDLRESGAIEQDADIVTFIYRPGYYELESEDFDTPKDLAQIIISKHRNGGLGTVDLRFIPEYVKFTDFDHNANNLAFDMDDPFASGGVRTFQSRMNDDDANAESPF